MGQENKDDRHKKENRGEDFKERLENLEILGVEHGIRKGLMKEWSREMKETFTAKENFMSRRKALLVLYHDKCWEKVDDVLTEMQVDLNNGIAITELKGNTHSILREFQAKSIFESIRADNASQSTTSAFSPSKREHHPTSSTVTADAKETRLESDVAKESSNSSTTSNVYFPGLRRSIRKPITGHSSQLRAKKRIKGGEFGKKEGTAKRAGDESSGV